MDAVLRHVVSHNPSTFPPCSSAPTATYPRPFPGTKPPTMLIFGTDPWPELSQPAVSVIDLHVAMRTRLTGRAVRHGGRIS